MTTVRAVAAQPGYVRQRAVSLVREADVPVLLLRARPEWPGEPVLDIDGSPVRVIEGFSSLAILDAYTRRGEDERLLVLTDRADEDLGDAVILQAWRQRVEYVKEWDAVPALFRGARDVDTELRRVGDWVATALLDHQPTGGWPTSPTPSLTSTLALGSLLAHLLGLPVPTDLDGPVVLSRLSTEDGRAAWNGVEPELRRRLTTWAGAALGEDVAFALRVGGSGRAVSPLAVALVVDVLWPDSDAHEPRLDELQVGARARIEAYVDSKPIPPLVAQRAAATARAVVGRMALDDDTTLPVILSQAEALLGDVGWPDGARRSTVLRAGLEARLEGLATGLSSDDPSAVESALRTVLQHHAARPDAPDVRAARMAVRLWRWLRSSEQETRTLADSLRRHVDDGAWADLAVGTLWNATSNATVAAAYRELTSQVVARRRRRDADAAQQLAEATRRDEALVGAVPVEDLLRDVVVPWTTGPQRRTLLVVLDGMSAPIAAEIAQAAAQGLVTEWVPSATKRRLPALAVLPTLTGYSRTSLLTGRLADGNAAEERAGLVRAVPRSVVFHKDDLRAPAGSRLPDTVTEAIRDEQTPVVAVVINEIDDTLHKQDVSGRRWDHSELRPLGELLAAAVESGRTVILTSDHGHVVERGTQAVPAGGADGRWRLPGSGEARDGEVRVSGRRVLSPGSDAVLLWDEALRYGRKQTGYHGGASLAEITVPVIVLQRRGQSGIEGWTEAAPQAPAWWNDPVRVSADLAAAEPVAPRKRRQKKSTVHLSFDDGSAQGALFEVPASPVAEAGAAAATSATDGVDALLASAMYAEQRERAGRRAVQDDIVAAVLRTLVEHGGRAHQDTVASAAGIPAATLSPTLAAIRRVVNVDGYEVLSVDADRVTVVLDRALLADQFDVEV
ncbi:BREX-2 system phosphatase PglZ [Cellulosimicrobium funkei]